MESKKVFYINLYFVQIAGVTGRPTKFSDLISKSLFLFLYLFS